MATAGTQEKSVLQQDSRRSGRVLRVGPLKPSLSETLIADYDALVLPDGDDRDEFLTAHGSSITAVVTSGRTGVDAALMDRLPQLGAVVNFGVGYDTTDVEAAAERGIAVSNTPDVLTDCVADLAVGLVIDTLRGLSSAERFVRAGRWPDEGNSPLTHQVTGRRVGIIGLGRIGSAIADRLNGFRCPISYHNRNEIDGSPYTYAASPEALAGSVDVLIIAASGGSGTAHLVDRAVLEALGPQGYLINVARGSVVDEEVLIELLAAGKLAGAGLDVFAHEPNVPEALIAMDNVVLLPHVGSGTVETRAAMQALTLENLDRFLADGTLVTPVTR
ncbi:2-hydroxyacid dehydrogenase [Rhodococcus sp. 077-4]|uniref:2-hydroxyacid dehydrogenase n=1 Tax=Rhodococcus sp. 077-4 TaxID=2789271 RepID=UPI0039F4B60F